MQVKIAGDWHAVLAEEFEKEYFERLAAEVREAYLGREPVYPPPSLLFNAFSLCQFTDVRVVILGQDPYHGADQAHGLAFSVQEGVPVPPSLQNIYKEITSDLGRPAATAPSGNLESWAKQGVLLLNSSLSVAAGRPNSHQPFGWENFTDAVIQKISNKKEHVVFLLWGAFAAKKAALIDSDKHLILTAPHPSPLSAHRGFFGCRHFSKTNAYLEETGQNPIEW